MCKKFILASLIIGIVLLSGCASHVDSSSLSLTGVTYLAYDSVTFAVPEVAYTESVDYHTITDIEYQTSEERDVAIVKLIQSAISGVSEIGFLLTKSQEYCFYVTEVSSPTTDLLGCDRSDLLSLLKREDISVVYNGRCIINEDEAKKAVMRLEFQIADVMGTKNTYSGYYGIAEINSKWYGYLAGYKLASEAQLKQCFNLVRSME